MIAANFAQFVAFCPDIMFLTKDSDRIHADWLICHKVYLNVEGVYLKRQGYSV
jgi:hypothetical protein